MDNNIPAGYNCDGNKGLEYIDLPGRSIPVDQMLYEDTVWLVKKIVDPVKKFLKNANRIELRQEDWDMFWKACSQSRDLKSEK